jgi:hypothetical protein
VCRIQWIQFTVFKSVLICCFQTWTQFFCIELQFCVFWAQTSYFVISVSFSLVLLWFFVNRSVRILFFFVLRIQVSHLNKAIISSYVINDMCVHMFRTYRKETKKGAYYNILTCHLLWLLRYRQNSAFSYMLQTNDEKLLYRVSPYGNCVNSTLFGLYARVFCRYKSPKCIH